MPHTPEEIRQIAASAAAQAVEQYAHQHAREAAEKAVKETAVDHEHLRHVVKEAVGETLTALGIDHDDPLEVQRDMRYLREWRVSIEGVRQKGFLTMVGIAVSGTAVLLWMGFKKAMSE